MEENRPTLDEVAAMLKPGQAKEILRGTVRLLMFLGCSPVEGGEVLEESDNATLSGVSHAFGNYGSSTLMREVASRLRR